MRNDTTTFGPGPIAVTWTRWYAECTVKDRPKGKGQPSFHLVVEAADRLSAEEQDALIEVLNRRLADRRRAELVKDIQDARQEYGRGGLHRATPEEIMKEILS